jgi:hypothetical protein
MVTEDLGFDYETWSNISMSSQQLVKKQKGKAVWVNYFDTVYSTEEGKNGIH